MSTLEVGKKLVSLCREGKFEQATESLYDKDIVSVEAAAMPGLPQEVRGIAAVVGKGKWWTDNHEVHKATVEGPFPNGDRFAARFTFDVTFKPEKKRITLDEVGLYTVKDGKIVREEFFYVT